MWVEYSCGLRLSESWGFRSYSQFKRLFGSRSSRVWSVTESYVLSPGFATYWQHVPSSLRVLVISSAN